jgi:hypothetical protein
MIDILTNANITFRIYMIFFLFKVIGGGETYIYLFCNQIF